MVSPTVKVSFSTPPPPSFMASPRNRAGPRKATACSTIEGVLLHNKLCDKVSLSSAKENSAPESQQPVIYRAIRPDCEECKDTFQILLEFLKALCSQEGAAAFMGTDHAWQAFMHEEKFGSPALPKKSVSHSKHDTKLTVPTECKSAKALLGLGHMLLVIAPPLKSSLH